jgi:uncharacterized membrane protein
VRRACAWFARDSGQGYNAAVGAFHPEVVHFAIALLILGVACRALSLFGWPRFLSQFAATLLILGTLAAVAAVYTGDAAHGPIEQMPGLRPIVTEHEEWGERARNIFLVVALIELAALAFRRSSTVKYLLIASTVVGVVGLAVLYEAGEHGGEIVYAYAGGVGTRSGDPSDVSHLLLAGLYQQALADRKAGKPAEAATLVDLAARRFPDNVDVQLMHAESLLLDRKDPAGALAALRAIAPPAGNRPLRIRHGMLMADALEASGQHAEAISTLEQLVAAVPSPRVQQRLDALKGKGGKP